MYYPFYLRPNWGALSKTIGSNTPPAGEKKKKSNPWQLRVCLQNQMCVQQPRITNASSSLKLKVQQFQGSNILHSETGFSFSQIQPNPSRWPIKRFSEKENMLNYGASEDDPAPYVDNLSSYLHISSLVLSCWLRWDVSFLPWQAVKAISWGWAPFICLLLVLSLTSCSPSCWDSASSEHTQLGRNSSPQESFIWFSSKPANRTETKRTSTSPVIPSEHTQKIAFVSSVKWHTARHRSALQAAVTPIRLTSFDRRPGNMQGALPIRDACHFYMLGSHIALHHRMTCVSMTRISMLYYTLCPQPDTS